MNKILAVEDDVTQRYVLKIVLESFAFDFTIVACAEEALRDLFEREINYVLVLMDIRLPIMNGFECTQEIRRREQKSGSHRIPIIAVTAYASAEDRQLCLDAGMDDYISKPYTLEALKALIDKYLAPARLHNDPSQNEAIQPEEQAHP